MAVVKSTIPTEDIEQITLINFFRTKWPDVLIFHIPNGGKRSITQAVKFQKMGVVAGIPDLCIPEWRLWIEMKRKKDGRLSKEQKQIIEYLEKTGYTVIIGKGWEDAKEKILDFLQKNACNGLPDG